ncbi:glycosyltransferase family 2 protein [Leptolyngbya sp. BL0902]|uniref:glycosyltransferase family 2 protein n=1 Tax=Leptolyngbya sp. BL0902 TaxID=1115757 RepID=UPI0018E731B5|nr:glycosyltransferase family 2 protein [Leptolyngbya sp. BL0902]
MANPLKISIVTPSFNQATFLEATLHSVLGQGYPNLEYRVIDGGSSDSSQEILERYSNQLSSWCSEPDQGQYDAINKGFHPSSGDIMAWINSDDMYTPWAFQIVNEIFTTLPDVEWLTTLCPIVWNAAGSPIYCAQRGGYTRQGFFKGENVPDSAWYSLGAIQQESVFWRRSLWEKAGANLDTRYPLAADFELWARFFQHADLYTVSVPLGGFRTHGNQRSVAQAAQYQAEVNAILKDYGGRTLGKLGAITTKILKDYVRLPYAARRRMTTWKLKPVHKHCAYDPTTQRWQVTNL